MRIRQCTRFFLIAVIALAACNTTAPALRPPPAAAIEAAPLPAPAPPPVQTLTAYKRDVARHVMQRNAHLAFDGVLPPLVPAIVVLTISADRDGRLADVQVVRSRDTEASGIALASVRRSGPLPRPYGLAPPHGGLTTFSETFLFGERYRFQLRSLAGPQASGL